jgi:hypothetical protein
MKIKLFFDDTCYDIVTKDWDYICKDDKNYYYHLVEELLTESQYDSYTGLEEREFDISLKKLHKIINK